MGRWVDGLALARYLDNGSQLVEYFSCVHLSAAPPPSVIVIDCFDALFPPAPEADMLTKMVHTLSLVTSTLGFEWLPSTTGTAQHNPSSVIGSLNSLTRAGRSGGVMNHHTF